MLAKVCLELGGKNPLVVCDDADLTLAAEHAVASAFIDAGQRCAAGSRIIVFDSRLRRVPRRAARARGGDEGRLGPAGRLRTGDLARRASIGCWRRSTARSARGARVLAGGHAGRRRSRPATTWRRRFSRTCRHDDEISQQELFGPVTCLYRVADFDEAVALANATDVRPDRRDPHPQQHTASSSSSPRYRAGLVSINGPTYGAGPHMPFGGVKNSGNGFREPGTEALDVYCEWKTVVVNHDPARV